MDTENEMALLGACMYDYSLVIPEMLQQIRESDFISNTNKRVFTIIKELYENNRKVNIASVKIELTKKEPEISPDILKLMLEKCLVVSMYPEYIKQVKEIGIKKLIIGKTQEVLSEAGQADKEPEELIYALNTAVTTINESYSGRTKIKTKRLRDSLPGYLDKISLLVGKEKGTDEHTKVKTGFYDIDSKIGGLLKGGIHYVGGRPGHGKTTFLLQIAMHIAQNIGPIYFCAFETPEDELDERILCLKEFELKVKRNGKQIVASKLKRGPITADDIEQLSNTTSKLHNVPFYYSTESMSVQAIKMEASKIPDLRAIFIDRIEILNEPPKHGENETHRLSRVSMMLNKMASSMKIPVACIVQLRRESEDAKGKGQKKNHQPTLRDLRDSGALEQDAKMVLLVHREDLIDEKPENKNKAMVIIAKNMFGNMGKVDFLFPEDLNFFLNSGAKYEG